MTPVLIPFGVKTLSELPFRGQAPVGACLSGPPVRRSSYQFGAQERIACDSSRGSSLQSGTKQAEGSVHFPRAPTPEPSSKQRAPTNNRHPQKGKLICFLPTAGITFQLPREGCRVGSVWSASLCFACWSLWLAGPGPLSLLVVSLVLFGLVDKGTVPSTGSFFSGTPFRTTLLTFTCLLYFAYFLRGWR